MRNLIGSAFALVLITAPSRAEILDRVLAVVGEEPVLQSDLRSIRREAASSPALASILRIDPNKTTDVELLNRLIEEKIIKQALKDLDMVVTEADVDKQIDAIARQNRVGRKQLDDQLRREGISPESYRANIRSQLERRNIFERELRRGGGVSEQEIRSLYEQRAGKELRLSLVTGPESALKALASQKVRDMSKLKAPLKYSEIGWVSVDSLNERIVGAAGKAGPGDVLGPIRVGSIFQAFVVHEARRGSEEEFQRLKSELSSAAQAKDFESRFNYWLEQKRREMQIILNVDLKG